ncbi:MAG: adenine phosphoribosyltransferase [Aestuariivita sp.]|nr:adenine phosphoribosyltransferase [Aestuariivita sp.]MCY4346733.1 adenine phosphoribosyltransferase [Aestuariivita sp.]
MTSIKDFIRTIPDFPHEGIMFRDVTTLFANPDSFRLAVDQTLQRLTDLKIDLVVGIEARGFILGGAIAYERSLGFVPIRKKGKLPSRTIEREYSLEYGNAVVEIHDDAIQAGDKVLLADDLLATGGTAEAAINLIERLGGDVIACSFIVDLPELGGRQRLEQLGMRVQTLCEFSGK